MHAAKWRLRRVGRRLGLIEEKMARTAITQPIVPIASGTKSSGRSLREAVGQRSMDDWLSQWQPVQLSNQDLALFKAPSDEFVQWASDFPRQHFDGTPASPNDLRPVSFMQRQIHRHWVTLAYVRQHLQQSGTLLDIGSFPFGIPLALRDFYKFTGPIWASVIQPMNAETEKPLRDRDIKTFSVDLDPHVVDQTTAGLPSTIPLDDNSVDVVLLAHVIEHLYHPMTLLREIARVLRSGGTLIVTTDNGNGVQTIANLLGGAGYVHEPVGGTAAMTISAWRGHVRFFTATDLSTMMEAAGLISPEVHFDHLFYDAFATSLFAKPYPTLPAWQLELIGPHPQFRNDMAGIATKP